jgi:hypothetical protein
MHPKQLRDTVAEPGPFASVYLDASHDTEDAAHQNDVRWRAVSAELASLGADDRTVAAIGDVVLGDPPVGDAGRALVGANGRVLADGILPAPPVAPLVRFGSLPYLVPVLIANRPPVPHVVVVTDKIEGTFRAVDREGTELPTESVRGRDHPIHHVSGGGLAHGSMENRAEETVRQNLRQVAERATKLVEQVGAEVLIVVGEVQATSNLLAELPEHVRRMVTEVDLDAAAVRDDPAPLSEAVERLLAQCQAERDEAAVRRVHEGVAHGLAGRGLAVVTEALRIGQVDTLLISESRLGDRTVFVGSVRTEVATRRGDLVEDRDEDITEVRADEALPVAAIGTAADVVVLADGQAGDDTVEDGVAAVFRFAR